MQVNRSYGDFKQSKNYSKSNVFFFNSIYACTKTNIINVKSKNYVVTHLIPPIFLLKNIIFFSKNFVISLFNSFTFSCYWDHGIIEW